MREITEKVFVTIHDADGDEIGSIYGGLGFPVPSTGEIVSLSDGEGRHNRTTVRGRVKRREFYYEEHPDRKYWLVELYLEILGDD